MPYLIINKAYPHSTAYIHLQDSTASFILKLEREDETFFAQRLLEAFLSLQSHSDKPILSPELTNNIKKELGL